MKANMHNMQHGAYFGGEFTPSMNFASSTSFSFILSILASISLVRPSIKRR